MGDDAPAWHRRADRPTDTATRKRTVDSVQFDGAFIPSGGSEEQIVGIGPSAGETWWMEMATWTIDGAFTPDISMAFKYDIQDDDPEVQVFSTVQPGSMVFDPAFPVEGEERAGLFARNHSGADVLMDGALVWLAR